AFDPELALLPEDALRREAAQLADAEPRVEQGPDDEPLGGCLAGVGQAIKFVRRERLSHVLIRHLPPPNSCVFGVGTRSRCAFRRPGYPHRKGHESGVRPRKQGGLPCGPIPEREAGVRDPLRRSHHGTSRPQSPRKRQLGSHFSQGIAGTKTQRGHLCWQVATSAAPYRSFPPVPPNTTRLNVLSAW